MKKQFLIWLVGVFTIPAIDAQDDPGNVIAWWGFEDPAGIQAPMPVEEEDEDDDEDFELYTTEKISGVEYGITGLAKFVPGIQGTAIKFDGFSSYIEGGPSGNGSEDEDEEEWELHAVRIK